MNQPSHAICLNTLLDLERLLREGPGIRQRTQWARDLLRLINGYTVESTNLMSGATIHIDARDKGTCCDPGTERYWSM